MDSPLHRHVCRVRFADTDASGWMHFPNAFHYFEAAEHEFLEFSGLLVFDRKEGGWPRVNVRCEYDSPLVCGDEIEVQLAVTKLGNASVTWNFEIHHLAGQRTAAHGSVTTVRVDATGKPQALSNGEREALSQ